MKKDISKSLESAISYNKKGARIFLAPLLLLTDSPIIT